MVNLDSLQRKTLLALEKEDEEERNKTIESLKTALRTQPMRSLISLLFYVKCHLSPRVFSFNPVSPNHTPFSATLTKWKCALPGLYSCEGLNCPILLFTNDISWVPYPYCLFLNFCVCACSISQVCNSFHRLGWPDVHPELPEDHGLRDHGIPDPHVPDWLHQSSDEQLAGPSPRPLSPREHQHHRSEPGHGEH